MAKITTKRALLQLVKEISERQKELETQFGGKTRGRLKLFREFLLENEIKTRFQQFLDEMEISYDIETIVVEKDSKLLLESQLLLEWEQYKKIPKTNLTYRYDVGKGTPGMQDHIHVYLGNTKNQVYAINKDSSPHDGSKAKLSSKEIKFLKDLGFTPPKDGLLEWKNLSTDKEYLGYKRQLLFS